MSATRKLSLAGMEVNGIYKPLSANVVRHRERTSAHAARYLSPNGGRGLDYISDRLREFLRIEGERLRIAGQLGMTGLQLAETRSFVLDLVVKSAFETANLSRQTEHPVDECAIIAVGGYGRGELAPFSDLDILFLYTGRSSSALRQSVEQMLRILWDAGLTIGHSVRNAGECLDASRNDPHFRTALLTVRYLAGNLPANVGFAVILDQERRKRADAIIGTIRQERDTRYAKFDPEVFVQEPNIKDGAGGMRDFHTGMWLATTRYGCRSFDDVRTLGLVSDEECSRVETAYDFMWGVRFALHDVTRRKTERLALDLQTVLARKFAYDSDAYLLATERFMRDYYRHARELNRFCHSMVTMASEVPVKRTRRWPLVGALKRTEPVSISNGRLQPEGGPGMFSENPQALFDAFSVAQAAGVKLGHNMREAVRVALPRVDRKFRFSPTASLSFMTLLRRKGKVGPILRLMHEAGFLERFLPEFGRISLLIQHDLYHHYTVDEHTLRAIDALDQVLSAEDAQARHMRILLDQVENVGLLYLSVLLHDIGKGRGPGHIPRGVKIAEGICLRFCLSEADTAKVLLMVKNHVTMAQLAQRRDLNEPQIASQLAEELGSVDALNMLLLLTYADLNAVAPGVWSEWKGKLLWDLYQRTRTLLTGGESLEDESNSIARFKEQVVNSLDGQLPLSQVERHLALLPERYIRVTRPDTVAMHLSLIDELNHKPVSIRWLTNCSEFSELTVSVRDRHGLFADIAGSLAANGVEILSAELNTREDGIAIDVFALRQASTRMAVDTHRYTAIDRALRRAISGESNVAELVARWQSQNAPKNSQPGLNAHRRNLPKVVLDNESSRSATIVEVRAIDEPGLAYRIASGIAALGLDIVCAKIATEKSDALDVFYVTDSEGRKLSKDVMHSVERSLTDRLKLTAGKEIAAASLPQTRGSKEKLG
jgi:[protein-PII] uridylyltransferase